MATRGTIAKQWSHMALTNKQALFVKEYLIDLNATQAAIRAGYAAKYANRDGPKLLSNPVIQQAIEAGMLARSQRTQITADMVLKRWWDVATADPNELIEYRRTCCRCCYGIDNRYQRTKGEMERDRQSWISDTTPNKPDFDTLGGVGYDPRRDPNPECQECFGEGVGAPFAKDTRKISAAARQLYAGLRVTKDGLEIKMRDQDGAMANVAKHLGMFVDKVEVTEKAKLVIIEEIVDGNNRAPDSPAPGPGGIPAE